MSAEIASVHKYREQEVMGASPLHLVVMAYDVAIRACEREDFERAVQAVGALRDALDFDQADAAMRLFRLYQWCLDCIRSGEYGAALKTLRELRAAWAAVEARDRARVAQATVLAGVQAAA